MINSVMKGKCLGRRVASDNGITVDMFGIVGTDTEFVQQMRRQIQIRLNNRLELAVARISWKIKAPFDEAFDHEV
jgi:hypothetical protein